MSFALADGLCLRDTAAKRASGSVLLTFGRGKLIKVPPPSVTITVATIDNSLPRPYEVLLP